MLQKKRKKELNLFAVSLGLQKHPTGFTCLATDLPFSGVLYWYNGSRNITLGLASTFPT